MDPEQSKQIETLYLELFGKLMAYARSALENEALAEEAVQEVFRIACQKPAELCGSPNPRGWLLVTLRNTIHNIKRSQIKAGLGWTRYLLPRAEELTRAEDPTDLGLLYGSLAETEEFRLLTEMVIEGRSYRELAASRRITEETCRKRVQRAREYLQKKIGK